MNFQIVLGIIIALTIGATAGYHVGKNFREQEKEEEGDELLEVDDLDAIGTILQKRRKVIGISRSEVQEKGVVAVHNIEINKAKHFSFLNVMRYARLIGYDKIIIDLQKMTNEQRTRNLGRVRRTAGNASDTDDSFHIAE